MTSIAEDSESSMATVGPKVGVADAPLTTDVDHGVHLVARAASGDAEAFEALLAPRFERLFRIAVAILRSEPDACDVLQDASLRAWRALPTLRDPARFEAWLTQIVVNACRSSLQRRRSARVHEVTIDTLDDGLQAPSRGAKVALPDLGEMEAVQRAFGRLDPPTRSLLVLHYVDGRPLGEISRIMGTPVGTIKWRLWRARRALGDALEAEGR